MIRWDIKPDDIEWEMDWGKNDPRGKEPQFIHESALAILLINDVVFLNSFWWKYQKAGDWNREERRFKMEPLEDPSWTEDESNLISINVICNDIFAWGCSDAEELPYDDIQSLYTMWKKDPEWGSAVWCMIKRNVMPQKPVEDAIRKAGIWDLDSLNLRPNISI